MAQQLLVNVLTVTVPAIGSVTVPHGLKSNGVSVAPKLVLPNGSSPLIVGAITNTSITFTNPSDVEVTGSFRVERGLSNEVDADTLETVIVGSPGGGVGGTANALQAMWQIGDSGFVPVYPKAGTAQTFLVGVTDKNFFVGVGPVAENVGDEYGPSLSFFGRYAVGKNSIVLKGGNIDIISPDYAPPALTFDLDKVYLSAGYIFPSPNRARLALELDTTSIYGANVELRGATALFGSVRADVSNTTPVAGTPLPATNAVLRLSAAAPVSMAATSPQIAVTVGENTLMTVVNVGAGAVTLTNAVGGQMKLKTSPLVINQYEAYDFIFADGFWIQR